VSGNPIGLQARAKRAQGLDVGHLAAGGVRGRYASLDPVAVEGQLDSHLAEPGVCTPPAEAAAAQGLEPHFKV
jgi:hypothetical protein